MKDIIDQDIDDIMKEDEFKLNELELIKYHRTDYLKWIYNDDLSIRYFNIFEDKKEFENKYFLKSHSKKEYISLTQSQALILLEQMEFKKHIQIIGISINEKYIKTIINENGIITQTIEDIII